jgi:ankyrin repeat protein
MDNSRKEPKGGFGNGHSPKEFHRPKKYHCNRSEVTITARDFTSFKKLVEKHPSERSSRNRKRICDLFAAACITGNAEMVERAITAVDFDIINYQRGLRPMLGDSPLMSASRYGHAEIVEMLLNSGADLESINKDGSTALILAVGSGKDGIVRMLIDAGAEINVWDWNMLGHGSKTPLDIAIKTRNLTIETLLEEKGAKRFIEIVKEKCENALPEIDKLAPVIDRCVFDRIDELAKLTRLL